MPARRSKERLSALYRCRGAPNVPLFAAFAVESPEYFPRRRGSAVPPVPPAAVIPVDGGSVGSFCSPFGSAGIG